MEEPKFLVKYSYDGRITLPREIRRVMRVPGGKGISLSIYMDGDKIIIEQPTNRCQFCGIKTENKIDIGKFETYICNNCCKKIHETVEE